MTYTAAEMRDESEWVAHTGNDLWALGHVTTSEAERIGKIAAMLRQAAEAMDANARLGWEGTLCPTCDTGGRCTYACGWHPPVAFAPATTKEGE
jgi:hypothetical protein